MQFASEEPERSISCHPELAKDLTTHQAALCRRSPFSKLLALLVMTSVPKKLEVKITSDRPREIPSTDSGQALRKLPMNLPVGDWLSAPTARPQCSLEQRPTAIKLRNSRSRSQAPAWERPCLGGSSLPFLTGALCFWRSGRRLEPPGILHSQAGAWERARVTRASKLNLMAVGQRPRSLSHNGLGLKARNRSPSTHCARPTAWDASFAKVLGRCPRLHCGWAVGPERRQAMPGSCPAINAALWSPASLRMTAFGDPFSLRRPAARIRLRLRCAKSLARVHSAFWPHGKFHQKEDACVTQALDALGEGAKGRARGRVRSPEPMPPTFSASPHATFRQ